jgi:hypothetical protein
MILFPVWHKLTFRFNLWLDELLDLHQDQEEAGIANTTGRRTRGVKIDFTDKKLPGEKEGAVDDDDDEEEEGAAETEPVVEGKGKGRAVQKPISKAGAGSGSKPVSKA